MDRITDKAERIANEIEPSEDAPDWDSSHLDPLREAAFETEERLREYGWLEENRGAETVTWHEWEQRRGDGNNPYLFDFFLKDAMETHIIFYAAHYGLEGPAELIEFVRSTGQFGGSEHKVVETYLNLVTAGVPDELYMRQGTMAMFRDA